MNSGILLVNLGSPDSTAEADVREYLREFLMDGRVIDAPFPVRWGIVHFSILPNRPAQSARAYERIWAKDGSPLILAGRRVQRLLQDRLGIPVEVAMRYRHPSIADAIDSLRAKNVDNLLLIPLFPHYAMSSYETAVVRVREVLARRAPEMWLNVAEPYFDNPDYIRALAASAQPYLEAGYDHLLLSFHGLPERHLRKSDATGSHCLKAKDCCSTPSPAHKTCYRAQCDKTARNFARAAGLPEASWSVSFQSRLGREPWLRPETEQTLKDLARGSVRNLLVMCPSFVADCLETSSKK